MTESGVSGGGGGRGSPRPERRRWCASPARWSRSGCSICFRSACARPTSSNGTAPAERVESVSALMFDQIAIETRPRRARSGGRRRDAGAKAMEAGLARFADIEDVERPSRAHRFRVAARRRAGARRCRDRGRLTRWPPACAASRNWRRQLAMVAWCARWNKRCGPALRRLMDEIAPVASAAGARARGQGALRSGSAAVDRIAPAGFLRHARDARSGARKVPVVVRLLAPNQRPVQMTSDLGGTTATPTIASIMWLKRALTSGRSTRYPDRSPSPDRGSWPPARTPTPATRPRPPTPRPGNGVVIRLPRGRSRGAGGPAGAGGEGRFIVRPGVGGLSRHGILRVRSSVKTAGRRQCAIIRIAG